MFKLSEKQKEIMEYMRDYLQENNFPPTIREITENFEFKSPKATQDHLLSLEKKGYIRKEKGRARRIHIIHKAYMPKSRDPGIPIIGAVAAGSTILASENVSGYLNFKELYGRPNLLFALKVRGDSMIYASINDGDYVIVRNTKEVNNGDIGVAVINGEATVKKLFFKDDEIHLIPENPKYQPIIAKKSKDKITIAGKVVGIHRVI